MAYPFRQMTTQELKKRSQDNRNKKPIRKIKPDSHPTHDLKTKSQEEICKN